MSNGSSSTGGTGSVGGTTQSCPLKGDIVVIANLVGETTRPFPDGMNVAIDPGGLKGKTAANGAKEFKDLRCATYKVTASIAPLQAKKFELIGPKSKTTMVPAGGPATVNFDIAPLITLQVKVKVKGSSPAKFLKPDKVVLKGTTGAFESVSKPDGTWEFRKLKLGKVQVEARLAASDDAVYEVPPTATHDLKESPDPNVLELEAVRKPVLAPLYLHFQFVDPQGAGRTLAGPIPVKVRLSDPLPARPDEGPIPPDVIDAEINANGVLIPPGGAAPVMVARRYQKLTIDLKQEDPIFEICEAPGQPAGSKALKYADTAEFRNALKAGRGFMLPWKRDFNLDTADWDIKDGTADAKPRFAQLHKKETAFGTPAQMLKLILKPKWQYARFTFFDRYFGYAHHSKLPVSLPPVNLRGYREVPAKAKVQEAMTAAEDAAAKAATLAEKRDALHLAQDIRDEKQDDLAWKTYLKNWHEANSPATDPDRIKAVADHGPAQTAYTTAAAAVTSAQGPYNTAKTAAESAATTAKNKREAAETEWAKVQADTISNWVVLTADDPARAVQCLPWILTKKADGSADAGPDAEVMLEFRNAAETYVESKSATERVRVKIPAGDARLAPGPNRLKVYDLPTVWRSRFYFAKKGAKANRFEQLMATPSTLAEPLEFCLDDLILCHRAPTGFGPVVFEPLTKQAWNPTKRCTILHHRFGETGADGAPLSDVAKDGTYKADTANSKGYFTAVPTGSAAGTANDVTTEQDRNYIADYPHWVRAVLALGNVYDVFDRRTPPSVVNVTGARAAACWRDVTDEMTGIEMVCERFVETSPGNGSWQTVAATNNRPSPNKMFKLRPQSWGGGQYFHLQPYVEFGYYSRTEKFNPAKQMGIGRVDFVLLRCCGKLGDGATAKEHVVHLHFTRNYFEFLPNAGTALTPTGMSEDAWKTAWIANVTKRWNGYEPTRNTSRARLLPDAPSGGTALPMEVDVLWMMHCTDRLRAQFHVTVENKGANARDNRGGTKGTGESSPEGYQDTGTSGEDYAGAGGVATDWFPSAHESGHSDGLPDEYNERWDGASHGQMSYRSNLPGDPFEPDGRSTSWAIPGSPMMNGNQLMRNRYFWHCAEWVRRRLEATTPRPFKVAYTAPDGTVYDKYQIPQHPTEGRTYMHWPVRHAIDAALAGKRGQRNLFLYMLGHEQFTVKELYARQTPPGAPAPNAAYDGICVITVNVEFLMPRWPLGAAVNWNTTNSQRQSHLRAVTRQMLNDLSFKYYLTGRVVEGAADWTFTRCLLFFSIRYLDGDATGDPSPGGLRNTYGSQFTITGTHNATGAASLAWAGGAGSGSGNQATLTMNFGSATAVNTMAAQIRAIFPRLFGVEKAMNAIAANDFVPLLAPLNVQNLGVHAI